MKRKPLRQAEEQLKASRADEFRAIFEGASDGILVAEPLTGRFVLANASICRMLGYTAEEITALGVEDIHPPADGAWVAAVFEKMGRGEIDSFPDVPVQRKDGSVVHVSMGTSPISLEGKLHIAGFFRDITERMKADAALQQREAELQECQRLARLGSWRLDSVTNEVTWSEELYRMLGFDPSLPPPPYPEHHRLFAPESWQRLSMALPATIQTGIPYELELEMIRSDGIHGWMLARGEAVRDRTGTVIGLRGTAMDITERKQVYESLCQRNEELDDLYNQAPCGYHSLDSNGVVVRMNDTELAWLGYRRDEVVGKLNVRDFLTEQSHGICRQNLPRLVAGEVAALHDLELEMIRKDGSTLSVLVNATALLDDRGGFLMSRSVVNDITERKRLERAMREQNALLTSVIDGTNVATWRWNIQTGQTEFNERWAEIVGCQLAELAPTTIQTWLDRAHPEDRAESNARLQDHFAGKQARYDCECRMRHKDGSWVWVHDRGRVTEWSLDGKPLIMTGTHSDITARKRAEAAGREEATFRSAIIERVSEGLCVCHAIAEPPFVAFTVWNPLMTVITGYTMEEINRLGWYQTLYPDPEMRARAAARMSRMREGDDLVVEEWEITRADGRKRLVSISTRMLKGSGSRVDVLALMQDITERKKAEAALRESEVRFRTYVNQAAEAIFAHDMDGRLVDLNQRACESLGYTRDELLGMSVAELEQDFDLPRAQQIWQQIAPGQWARAFGKHRRKDGSTFPAEVRASRCELRGQVVILVVVHDLTERLQTETSLKHAAQRHEQLRHALVAIDSQMEMGAALTDLLNSSIELGGMDAGAVYVIEGQEAVLRHQIGLDPEFIQKVIRRPLTTGYVKAVMESPGEVVNVIERFPEQNRLGQDYGLRHVYCIGLSGDHGLFVYLVMASRQVEPPNPANIELIRLLAQQAEAAFRRLAAETRLRGILSSMAEGVVVQAADGRIIDCNPSAERILGLSRDQMIGQRSVVPHWQAFHENGDVFPGEEHPAMVCLRTGKSCDNVTMRLQLPGGSQRWLSTNAEPVFRSGEDRPYAVVATFADITRRKRAEEDLRKAVAEKTALLKEIHHRVKNNLQIVASLLNLQSGRAQSREAADVLINTRNRVHAMSALHEVLYSSGNLAQVNFADYIERVCAQLKQSAGPIANRVRLERQAESLGLPMAKAVPCGLIITELVSNALKHGFPEERAGIVTIEMRRTDKERILLRVSDDGIGLPAGLNPSTVPSLGLRLIGNLAGQLGGYLTVESGREVGAGFQITFPIAI